MRKISLLILLSFGVPVYSQENKVWYKFIEFENDTIYVESQKNLSYLNDSIGNSHIENLNKSNCLYFGYFSYLTNDSNSLYINYYTWNDSSKTLFYSQLNSNGNWKIKRTKLNTIISKYTYSFEGLVGRYFNCSWYPLRYDYSEAKSIVYFIVDSKNQWFFISLDRSSKYAYLKSLSYFSNEFIRLY